MDFLALIRKEALALRRNLGLFFVLLVLIPGTLTAGTVVYEHTIPQDIPVGVVGTNNATTADDIAITRAGVTFFAEPVTYDTPADARRALQREEVYLVVEVPSDIMTEGANRTFTVVSDETIVPFQEPANYTVSLMSFRLDRALPADITVEHDRLGERRELSEYLVPTGLLSFVVLYALVYIPYQTRRERLVLDRLQTESRLELVAASKLLFFGSLLVVPLLVIGMVTRAIGYDVAVTSPLALLVVFLTFTYLAAIGLAVAFALRFDSSAIFLNLGLSLGIFSLSSFVYPVGFFSATRKMIARTLPTHYSVVTMRSAMLRETPVAFYTDYLLWLTATTVVSLIALGAAIRLYKWRQ